MISKTNCYGCSSCMLVCPTNAITMERANDGFKFPTIDVNKCVNCNKCEKVCINHNNIADIKNFVRASFAVKEIKFENSESATAGIAYQIAKAFIENSGIVYGCINDSNIIKHCRIFELSELPKTKNSKYVQSDIDSLFISVKNDLKIGKKVLFTGTPCQIAGLKLFLGRDFIDNLYTLEIMCHGVPSQLFFDKYINWLNEKKKDEIHDYIFRDKSNHVWGNGYYGLAYGNRKLYSIDGGIDPFYRAFLDGKCFRESCYNCEFSTKKRVADITVGDFWGIQELDKDFYSKSGVSFALISSNKGEFLAKSVDNLFVYKQVDINSIAIKQTHLSSPSARPKSRDTFYDDLINISFDELIKKYNLVDYSFKGKIKRLIPKQVKDFIKNKLK